MKALKKFFQEESAQGATEYILLLVVVVTIAMMFREQIQGIIQSKIADLGSEIGEFNVGQ